LGTIPLFVPAKDGVAAARLAHPEFGGELPPVQNADHERTTSRSCEPIFAVVIDAAGLVTGQTLLIVATGGIPASVQPNNAGTIAGSAVYTLRPGTALTVQFDGINLIETQ
jgi:hypothetical protein